jgi:hypothetical protein
VIFERDLILAGKAELWPSVEPSSRGFDDDPMAVLVPTVRDQVERLLEKAHRLLSAPGKEDFFTLLEQARKRVVSSLSEKADGREDLLALLERWNVVAIEGTRAVDWLVWDGIAVNPVPVLAARLRMDLVSGTIVRITLPFEAHNRPILLRAHELVPRTDPPSYRRPLSWGQLRAIGAVLDEHHVRFQPEATTRRGLDRVLHDRGLKVGKTGIISRDDPDVPLKNYPGKKKVKKKPATRVRP